MTELISPSASNRKTALQEILLNRDFPALIASAENNPNPFRLLISFQFNSNLLICMRAVEALGKVAALYAVDDLESLKKLIRRFFWMMNDESGNVGWYAPEAIGEILHNVPILIPEYAHLLPSFLVEEPFEKGTRIAIARIAEIDKSPFDLPTCKKLVQSLDDFDANIRGSSLVALKALAVKNVADRVRKLANDSAEIELYNFDTGLIQKVTVGSLARDFQ